MGERDVSLRSIVGGGYDEFWNSKHTFRVVKGSKGSKKSKTQALWLICHIMQYPDANALVIRKIFETIKQSCFTDLLWAIDRLGVTKYWKESQIPLQLTYRPTGQVIMFRGLDDPLKLASIAVRNGVLSDVWIEEATEITSEDAFDKLWFSIRGKIPEGSGLWRECTMTFNPWSEHTWIKARFFDRPDPDVLTMTTTYKVNEFLDETDIKKYEDMYIRDPRRARVFCDGEWGVSEGLIYDNWTEEDFDYLDILKQPDIKTAFGLDFGYAVSFNAFVAVLVDLKGRKLWIYDEMYEKGLTNIDIAKKITKMGYGKEEIWADAAEPKSISELRAGFTEEKWNDDCHRMETFHWQLPGIIPALKGRDSVSNGIQRLQSFEIVVHPKCENVLREFSNYSYAKDRDGNFTDQPDKEFDHAMDALRYAMGKFFSKGRGTVYEAKGIDTPNAFEEPAERRKSRRVFSTSTA